jgi:hypothetical protein
MGFDYGKAATTSASSGRKPFIEPGIEAEFLISHAKLIEGGFKGTSYVFEFRVLDAKAIDATATAPVKGAERAYVVDLDGQYGLPNLMAVAEALEGGTMPGLSDDQKKALLTEGKSMDQIAEADKTAKGNALKTLLSEAVGMRVRATTSGVKTRENKPFTAITWHHVPGQTIETVRETRAKMANGQAV